ncbi:D-isomer specific 2-hydroxyacid dehydrogenase family protein [Luethyella okanaganae]|uniref:D-isomer specific 2-hydroxyacid dehydrogenase family protein n=1 Tax=Luethyella okanaganae TaxID=69372 RepID=A0ABW1VFH2_9MICO
MSASARHRAVFGAPVRPLPSERRPTSGPIAILPEPEPDFEAAVAAAGGTVSELSDETRGLVWLSYERSAELGAVVHANPQLEWVQLPWAGVDGFAEVLRAENRPGLLWTSAKGAYAQPVAEHALALSLALMRMLPKRVLARHWNSEPEGVSLFGRNVVIVGAGGIALELVRLLKAFDACITIVRRRAKTVEGAVATVTSDRLHEVLPSADLVIVAAALTGGTRHLLGDAEFQAMPESAYVVNVARGPLVDTDALVAALHAGTIAGAGVDVTDPEPLPDGHPLWTAPNCIVTPHMADTPEMTAPLLAERIRLNVEAFMGGARFVGVVDPEAGY